MVNFYSEFVNCNTSRKATMRDVIGITLSKVLYFLFKIRKLRKDT